MYCSACGNKANNEAKFCDSCGAKIVRKKVSNPKKAVPPDLRVEGLKKFSRRTLWVLFASVAGISVATVGVISLLPMNVPFTLSVKPVGTFAFSESCQPVHPSVSASEAVAIDYFADGATKAISRETVNGKWSRVGGDCLFTGVLSVPRNASAYSAWVAAEDEYFYVATKAAIQSEIEISATVGALYSIRGTIQIKNTLESSDLKTCRNSVTALGGPCGGIYWDPISEDCFGTRGYSDLYDGSLISLLNGQGQEVARGQLSAGTLTGSDVVNQLKTKPWTMNCKMSFRIDDVPGHSSYSIKLGQRGENLYSFQDLETSDWVIALEIGD
jgi:hypothetical protein